MSLLTSDRPVRSSGDRCERGPMPHHGSTYLVPFPNPPSLGTTALWPGRIVGCPHSRILLWVAYAFMIGGSIHDHHGRSATFSQLSQSSLSLVAVAFPLSTIDLASESPD
jgi:hypothetical protein